MKIEVPFYLQTTALNCGPIALKMALEFLGEKYSIKEMERLTEIKGRKAVSTLQLAIAAAKLGFKVEFYSKNLSFNPENLEMDFYKKYSETNEETTEIRIEKARQLGVKLNEKTLTINEIIENIKEDRVIIILFDWNVVRSKEGYQGHFVPVVGYDDANIFVHNHGFSNPGAFMPIPKDIFEKARKAKGTDEDILIIYRKH